jgi:hypothetical protein
MRKMNLLALMCIVICLVACDNVKVKMASDNTDEITATGADGKNTAAIEQPVVMETLMQQGNSSKK